MNRWTVVGGESVGGEAVDRGRWNTEGRPLATGYRLPITGDGLPTTDHR
jgi:hypothetical protein